ncbi:MAG: MarR family transcriptional regulator [Bacteroidetes bacterium]|nr:MarR family transcriptional regulator [Bacteroidota bacterium]
MSTHSPHSAPRPRTDRLEEEVSLDILRTAFALEHFLAEGLKEHGLTMTQYNVLRILRGAGKKGLCRNDVGARMLSPVPDATRLIDRLIASGYAQKDKDPNDKRYTATRITEKGLDLLTTLDEPIMEMHRFQWGHLSAAELVTLSSLLRTNKPPG